MAGLAAAKEISVYSAGAAALLEFDGVFTLKEELRRALKPFLGGKSFVKHRSASWPVMR